MYALLLLYTILAASFVLGYPIAWWLLRSPEVSAASPRTGAHIFYLAPIYGFTALITVIYAESQLLSVGTDQIARVTTLVLLVAALVCSVWLVSRRSARSSLRSVGWYVPIILAAPLAAFNVLAPIVAGRWDMAYSGGNDGARYLMMVTFLRIHPWEWFHQILDPLPYRLIAHALDHLAGAVVASLFDSEPAIADSLVAVVGAVLGAAAFCLLFETLFSPRGWIPRYAAAAVAVALFGFWGATTDIYYTGFLGQHFSIMPVLAALSFSAIRTPVRRLVWHAYWCVFLALAYSISLTAGYAIAVGMYALLPAYNTSWRRRIFGHFPALSAGIVLALVLDPGERVILQPGSDMAFSSRDEGYRRPAIDTVLHWAGVISRYERPDVLTNGETLLTLACIGLALLLAAIVALRLIRRQPALAAICVAIGGIPGLALLVGHNYVAEKTSLYIGFPIALALLGAATLVWQSARGFLRATALLSVLPLFGLVFLSTRLIPWYWELADARYTKVDTVTEGLVQAATALPAGAGDRPTVFAVDLSPERHLLLRELFRDYLWQPVRDDAIWGEFYVTDKNHPQRWDDYSYSGLLNAETYRCGPISYSGNAAAMLFDSAQLTLYGPHASTLEQLGGLDYERGAWDANRNCYEVQLMLQEPVGKLLFVNNGEHRRLSLTLANDDKKATFPGDLVVNVGGQSATFGPVRPGLENWSAVNVEVILPSQRLVPITVERGSVTGKVGILHATWGY